MLRTTTALILIGTLAACASSAAVTSWGKAGVSMVDYRLDSAQCIIEATAAAGQPNTPDATAGRQRDATSMGNNTAGDTGVGTSGPAGLTSSGGAISYQGAATPEVANQAAMQQRAQEMAAKRAQKEAMNHCLASRGYREFRLTPEQAARLSQLPEGSVERREYLYSIGTDPNVIATQGL
jgi:hypothetical protein